MFAVQERSLAISVVVFLPKAKCQSVSLFLQMNRTLYKPPKNVDVWKLMGVVEIALHTVSQALFWEALRTQSPFLSVPSTVCSLRGASHLHTKDIQMLPLHNLNTELCYEY